MADNSVGRISLDLVIREKISEQLEKIKARVSTPAEKIGETVEEAIEKPMKNAGKAVADSVSKALETVDEEVRKVLEGAREDTSKAILEQLERTKKQQKELEETLNKPIKPRVVPAGPKFMPYDSSKITQEMEEYNKKMQEKATKPVKETIEKVKEKLGDAELPAVSTEKLGSEVERTNTKLGLLQKKWQELSSVAAGVGSKIKSALSKAFNHIKNVGGKALSALGSRFKSIGKSASDSMKPVRKLGNTLKNTFQRVFLVAGIYAAFRALKDGLLEAAKADEQFSDSLNAVKANLAIAFQPVMQAIMPALNALMSGLAAVTKQIAGFIAGLFGTTYKQAADAAKKLKGVTDAAKKAKLATAGIDEMNILSSGSDESESSSGIDYSKIDMSEPELPDWAELLKNAIKKGDWSGAGAILADRVNAAFSAVNWDSISAKVNNGVRKITDGINGFIGAVDWSVLGDAFVGGLNTITGAVDTFYRTVKWDKLGSGIASGLNRAIKKTNWVQLGSAFAGRLQAMIETAFAFVKDFDFEALGSGIGDAVNGWFDRIDFGMASQTLSKGIIGVFSAASAALRRADLTGIGQKIASFVNNIDISGILSGLAGTLSDLVSGALELAVGFVENTDWISVGEGLMNGIAGAVASVDWGGVISKAFELLGSAIGGAAALASGFITALWDILVKAWDGLKSYFNEKISECGGNVAAGIFDGILTAFANVGNWIKDHIFKPFVEGFCKAFGIHSPSKEMSELGGFLIDGLYNAVSEGIKRIKEIFEKLLGVIKNVFSGIGKWFSDRFSEAWDGIVTVFTGAGQWFSDRWDDITEVFSSVGGWFGDRFTEAWEAIKLVFSDPGKFFRSVWSEIKKVFGNVRTWFGNTFSGAWEAVKGVFWKVKDWFTDHVLSPIESIADGIKSGFVGAINAIIDAVNWITGKMSEFLSFEIPDWVPVVGGKEWSISIPSIDPVPLAAGGIADAPTLALVGEYSGASTDPEVISPLSKLKDMLGDGENGQIGEIIELLNTIITLLRNGLSAELVGSLFGSEFRRAVLKITADDKSRRWQ